MKNQTIKTLENMVMIATGCTRETAKTVVSDIVYVIEQDKEENT
jgi:hypothetical protein